MFYYTYYIKVNYNGNEHITNKCSHRDAQAKLLI